MAFGGMDILGGPAYWGAKAANPSFGQNLSNLFLGSSGRVQQAPLFNQQQQNAMSGLLGQGMQNADFSGIENRARNQFRTNMIPGLAERFTSMGGGQRSSAFQGALGGAESDLESQLAALRSQFGMQQLGMGLTPQFENMHIPSTPGIFGNLMAGGAQGLGSLLPLLMML